MAEPLPAIFVSFAKDKEAELTLRGLKGALESRGFEMMSTDPTGTGDDWSTALEEAVNQAAAGVVIVSPAALESPTVEREASALIARTSRSAAFRVVPLPTDGVDPANLRGSGLEGLAKLQFATASSLDERIDQVLAALAEVKEDGASPAPATSTADAMVAHGGARVLALATAEIDGRPAGVSGGGDGRVRVWDLAALTPLGEPLGHEVVVSAVAAVEIDGRALAVSGGTDGTLKVWDLAAGAELGEWQAHPDEANVSALAAAEIDGRVVAVSGSSDGELKVWDLAAGTHLRDLRGHDGSVSGLTVADIDARTVAVSGGTDGTLRLWDLAAGTQLGQLQAGQGGSVSRLAVAELDGRAVAFWAADGTLWTQDLGAGAPLGRRAAVPRAHDQAEWITDAPATTDLLGRQQLARALAARLLRIHADDPRSSFLIHVDGHWGSGKSTLLTFLRSELEQRSWLIVDFDAWRQSRVGVPWWALLTSLRQSMIGELGRTARWRLRIAETWERVRRAGAPHLLGLMLVLAAAVGLFFLLRPSDPTPTGTADVARAVAAVVTAIGTLWAGAFAISRFLLWNSAAGARVHEQAHRNPMEALAEHFGWLVRRAGRPVVVFLDDLDRCGQAYVVDLLDSVQTLIRDAPRRTHEAGYGSYAPYFVVAADGAWIRRSYETAYEGFEEAVGQPGRPLGYLFLDKIFQLTVKVPAVGRQAQETYLHELLESRGADNYAAGAPAEERAAVERRVSESGSENEVIEVLAGASPDVRAEVAPAAVEKLSERDVQSATEHALEKFASLLEPNPRATKRFVNAYGMARAVALLEDNLVPRDVLALWTILRVRWPSLADYLCLRPDAISAYGADGAPPQDVPERLRPLFGAPEVARLVNFGDGGPLTTDLVRACCGAPAAESVDGRP